MASVNPPTLRLIVPPSENRVGWRREDERERSTQLALPHGVPPAITATLRLSRRYIQRNSPTSTVRSRSIRSRARVLPQIGTPDVAVERRMKTRGEERTRRAGKKTTKNTKQPTYMGVKTVLVVVVVVQERLPSHISTTEEEIRFEGAPTRIKKPPPGSRTKLHEVSESSSSKPLLPRVVYTPFVKEKQIQTNMVHMHIQRLLHVVSARQGESNASLYGC